MDRRRGGTAAATFAADLAPVQGGEVAPHQDARLRRDERRGGEPSPPVARRRRLLCSTRQRAVRRRATPDPRAPYGAPPRPAGGARRGRFLEASTEILTR